MTIRETDVRVTDDGDLVLGEDGDFLVSGPVRTAQQDIAFRYRTQFADFGLHPLVGADLGKLLGEPNNRANADRIKGSVRRALTRDGRFRDSALAVEVVPVSPEAILILIAVTDTIEGPFTEEDDEVIATFMFNYTSGDMTIME